MPTRLMSCLFIIFVLIGALLFIETDISTAKDILIVKNDRAAHYPIEQLRQWFLDTARHRTNGYYRISGQQLINMGIPSC